MSFCILLCFCSAFGIPLSWKKLQCGVQLRWIGWDLDFAKGCVCIPPDKMQKLHELLQTGLCGKHIDRQTLSKIGGCIHATSDCSTLNRSTKFTQKDVCAKCIPGQREVTRPM